MCSHVGYKHLSPAILSYIHTYIRADIPFTFISNFSPYTHFFFRSIHPPYPFSIYLSMYASLILLVAYPFILIHFPSHFPSIYIDILFFFHSIHPPNSLSTYLSIHTLLIFVNYPFFSSYTSPFSFTIQPYLPTLILFIIYILHTRFSSIYPYIHTSLTYLTTYSLISYTFSFLSSIHPYSYIPAFISNIIIYILDIHFPFIYP